VEHTDELDRCCRERGVGVQRFAEKNTQQLAEKVEAMQQHRGQRARSCAAAAQRGSAAAAAYARGAQRYGARASIVSTFASSAACSVARTGVTL
jgi:hypothetical protein